MPYQVKKVRNGYKVYSNDGKAFSKQPLTKSRAEKQRLAIALNESKASNKPLSFFF